MISGLRIGNFKAFSETQHISVRPLTLIFGPNSSGKSSLIHSLVLAHQGVIKGNLDVHRTEIGGESVDLGGFKQYVFHRDTERHVEWAVELDCTKFQGRLNEIFHSASKVTIGITIGLGYEAEGFDDEDLNSDIDELIAAVETSQKSGVECDKSDTFFEGLKKYRYRSLKFKDILNKKPRISTYRIEVDNSPLLRMSVRKGHFLRLDEVNSEHPILKSLIKAILETSTTTEKVTSDDYMVIDEAISEMVSQISVEIPKFFPRCVLKEDQSDVKQSGFLMAVSKGQRKEDIKTAFNFFFPKILDEIVSHLTELIDTQLNNFRYLGPLRSYPPRHLAFSQYHDANWQAGGGFAWEEVRTNQKLRDKMNQWLSDTERLKTPYELVVHNLLTIDEFDKPYAKRLAEIENAFSEDLFTYMDEEGKFIQEDLFGTIYDIPKDLKNIESKLSEIRELALIDKRTETAVSHRDVGIGVSQVLPVLVSAYASKKCLIAIEQPEIHLHPKLQAELGDVFIESALGENKNTFLIETHSEHLILRIMRRMRETSNERLPDGCPPVKPEDISILYIQPMKSGSVIKSLELDAEGEFLDNWPDGFFEEGFRERFS